MGISISYFDGAIMLKSLPNCAIPKTMTKIIGINTTKAAKKLAHPIIRPKVSNLRQHRALFTRHIVALQTVKYFKAKPLLSAKTS